MTPFLWVALVLFVLCTVPCVVSFVLYLSTGMDLWQQRAVRFYRWAALVVLVTFNITIFKHIILTIIHW